MGGGAAVDIEQTFVTGPNIFMTTKAFPINFHTLFCRYINGPILLFGTLRSLVCYHRALCSKEVTKRNRSAIVSDGSLSKDVIPSPLNQDISVDNNMKILEV